MTAFVESCVQTAAGSAAAAERHARKHNHARRLLKKLAGKSRIAVSTHQHPDPDALASAIGLATLLRQRLPNATVDIALKGTIGGGLNEAFNRVIKLDYVELTDLSAATYDAICLVDVQSSFGYSPMPAGMSPFAVIDHHRARGRRPGGPFVDIRTDVGATSSILFSYFMELEQPISPDVSAALLFGIETDLAGAAGTPGELDNIALSSLVLTADTRKLYQMRHVDLPRDFYSAQFDALKTATLFGDCVIAHVDRVVSPEQPAILADFLLRYDGANWALVSAIHEGRMILSLRTSMKDHSAGDVMRRLLNQLGEGGGHRSKAGGYIPSTDAEKFRPLLRRRLLRLLGIRASKGEGLVDHG